MRRLYVLFLLLPCLLALTLPLAALQGKNDYLNEQEIDRIREAQEIDLRTKVFIFIAERRLKIVTGELIKQTEKEEAVWGPLPCGKPYFLVNQYQRAFFELMDKIDDAYERDPKSPNLKKALKVLLDAMDKHLKTLTGLQAKLKDEESQTALAAAIETVKTAHEGAKSAQ